MANEKVLGLVSGTRDGKLLVVTTPTRCDPPATGEVYAGLVSGTRNGKPLLAFSTQRCGDTAGTLENGQTYLGLVSGTRDGKLLLAVPCGDCGGGGPECPDCEPCGNSTTYNEPLTATVDVACFSAPFTVTLDKLSPYDGSTVKCDGTTTPIGELGIAVILWEGTVTETDGFLGSEITNACDGSDSSHVDIAKVRTCYIRVLVNVYLDEADDCYKQYWEMYFEASDNYDGYRKTAVGSASTLGLDGCSINMTVNACSPLDISASGDLDCLYGATAADLCDGYTTTDQCVGGAWTVEVTE